MIIIDVYYGICFFLINLLLRSFRRARRFPQFSLFFVLSKILFLKNFDGELSPPTLVVISWHASKKAAQMTTVLEDKIKQWKGMDGEVRSP